MILRVAVGKQIRVELRGLEPLTPTLPVWCATSCATAPGRAPDSADRGSIVHARGHAIGLANRSARSHESVTSVNQNPALRALCGASGPKIPGNTGGRPYWTPVRPND